VSQILRIVSLAAGVLLVFAAPVWAQDEGGRALINFSSSIAAGVTILGAGYGISKIGATAVESMARQPEVAGDIRGAMIVAAALIEGATFFALIVCIIK
jgi:F-type H+-transporting ATPase subunit c